MKDENSDRKGTLKEMNERECGRTGSVTVQNRKECDIIQDLLPSYVDNICSEASREWIEEHLAECSACKETAELMKNTELSPKRLEQESLNAAKKVIVKSLMVGLMGLVLGLIPVAVLLLVLGYDVTYNAILCMIMVWCMRRTGEICRKLSKAGNRDKWDVICFAGTVLVTVYGVLMLGYCFLQIVNGKMIFQLELNEVGPFIYGQMVLVAVLYAGIYLVQMLRLVKYGRSSRFLMGVCVIGIFLMMQYCGLMGNLLDLDAAVTVFRNTTIMTLVVAAAGMAGYWLLDKVFGKQK